MAIGLPSNPFNPNDDLPVGRDLMGPRDTEDDNDGTPVNEESDWDESEPEPDTSEADSRLIALGVVENNMPQLDINSVEELISATEKVAAYLSKGLVPPHTPPV